MTFCQWESAQFSLLNRACTGLLTRLGSPGDGEALDAGEGLAAADADGDGLGDGESFAPIRLAPRAWV